jgi:DNA-binding transcriptional LysR family regulator
MKKPRDFNFDVKQLRSFLEVTGERSFTRASRNLRVGQATISTHVSALEEAFGVTLIRRTSRAFTITREGEVLHEFCSRLFADLENLKSELARVSPPGIVTVAASTIPSAYILPKAVSAAIKSFNGIAFRIEVSDSREVVEMIKEGRAELGVVGKMLRHPVLGYEKIVEDELVLIAPAQGYPARVRVSDIPRFPFVGREKGSGTRDSYERSLADAGIQPAELHIVLECTTSEGVREAVASGLGVAFISRLAIPGDASRHGIRVVETKDFRIRRNFYLVTVKKKKPSAPALALMKELRNLKV